MSKLSFFSSLLLLLSMGAWLVSQQINSVAAAKKQMLNMELTLLQEQEKSCEVKSGPCPNLQRFPDALNRLKEKSLQYRQSHLMEKAIADGSFPKYLATIHQAEKEHELRIAQLQQIAEQLNERAKRFTINN